MARVIRLSEQELRGIVTDLIKMALGGDLKNQEKSPSNSNDNDNSNFGELSSNSKNNVPVDFGKSVNKVIDNFEGGYYHPDMNKSDMGNSGETMMGIDRKHGVGFSTSAAGKEFWGLIDNAGARKNWKHYYLGGSLENRLRGLVVEMIEPEYNKLSNKYLSSESREIVKNSPELTFNFIYATWNGPSWFQKFARAINDAVEDGITNPDDLIKVAIKSRRESGNSLIAKSGNIMSKLFNV